jgi:transposase
MISTEVFMDIFSLRKQGFSVRTIANKLGIHRETVKKHLETGAFPGSRKTYQRASVLDPYHQAIQDFLGEDDYKATWIFQRLQNLGFAGSYETVKRYVGTIKEQKTRLAYIRFETEPGLQAQVDFGDFQIQEPDGRTTTVYAFVMVLGFSRGMHVEYVDRCTLETFMDCHANAFRYLGGVPAEILYDNMKNVVIDRKEGRVNFNIEFVHFSRHFGFTPKACPPYSPWVKGKVERPMDYIRERFWRGYTFTSLESLNRDMRVWLDETANKRIHGTYHQPVIDRWLQEIPRLGALPTSDYDTSIKLYRKVYKDCQVSYNANRYLVPHLVVGKKVLLKIKNGVLRIFHDQDLLVTYREAEGKHNVVGNRLFYEQLKRDQEQSRRKYGKNKGKATRGLTTSSLFPQVEQRPMSDYDQFSQGGVSWNN